MSVEEVNQYAENLTNSYVGVGISVTKPENEYIYVDDVVPDSGAYAAGIMPGDYVAAVNGTDIKLMILDDVTEIIKGKEGTTVKLTISRDGNVFDVTVERRRIDEPSIEYQMIDDVGYVKIINFYDNTALNFKTAVEDLIANGAKGLVFDVRFLPNPYYIEELRPQTGLDRPVAEYVFAYTQTREFVEKLEDLLDFLMPFYREEGKLGLTVAIGCTGGHHRSVAIADALYRYLSAKEINAISVHRDIER